VPCADEKKVNRRVRNGPVATGADTGFESGSIDGPGGSLRDKLGGVGQV
jgi:hypothetical protein